MSKISRKIERGIARRKGKELQGGVDAVRRLVQGADGLTSISEAISLLKDIGPAVEECRNAALLAVQHAVAVERELERERFVRRETIQALRGLVVNATTTIDLDHVAHEASALWDLQNPAPALPADGALYGGP